MKYFLYYGCSLEASASHYLVSTRAIAPALGIEWVEIEDWNCCGASISYVGASELEVVTLNARNLAMAEAQGGYDIVAPCSSCYIILNKINRELAEDPALLAGVNEILAEDGMSYSGSVRVRHLLDVLYHDIGLKAMGQAVRKPLSRLTAAAYVGCQTARPFGEYDSAERPLIQDKILASLGARVVEFDSRVKCCGSGIFLTELDKAGPLVSQILTEAEQRGAQVVSTACPMCQMNLEIYQPKINRALGVSHKMPVVFITQLMAAAFGLNLKKEAALSRNIVPALSTVRAGLAA